MEFIKNYEKDLVYINKYKSISKIIDLYVSTESQEDFPFTLAKQTLINLKNTTTDRNELMIFVLEDIIYSSLYSTYYEQILVTVRENPDVAQKLITVFDENTEERERIISDQTENHIKFIQNNGFCKGCSDCANHSDLEELRQNWDNNNFNFLVNMYLGMQNIQNSMEQLLYEFLLEDSTLYPLLTIENVIKYRTYLYDDAQKRMEEYDKNILNI